MTDPRDLIERVKAAPWRAPRRGLTPLGRDISVVLLVKLAALAVLWWLFFSAPLAPRLAADPPSVEAHIVPPPTSPEPTHAER